MTGRKGVVPEHLRPFLFKKGHVPVNKTHFHIQSPGFQKGKTLAVLRRKGKFTRAGRALQIQGILDKDGNPVRAGPEVTDKIGQILANAKRRTVKLSGKLYFPKRGQSK